MSLKPIAIAALLGSLIVSAQQARNRGVFTDETSIGKAGNGGGVVFDSAKGEYRVSGAGADVWGTSDDFHFVWKKLTGNMSLSADVRWEGTGGFPRRKAMLMIRQSLDAGSPYVDAAFHGNG